MITNASCNRYLRERFAADDIWFILRFGYSPVPPRAPRLASVLLGEEGAAQEWRHRGSSLPRPRAAPDGDPVEG